MKTKKLVALILFAFFAILIFIQEHPEAKKVCALCHIFFAKGESRYSSIIDLKGSRLSYIIPENIYVEYLLESAIPSLRGPEGNEFDLDKPTPCEWFCNRDWEVLRRQKEHITPILIRRLKDFDNSAALVLGYLNVKEAIPLLRKAYLTDDYFYGWEGATASFKPNYTHHYCYEEALEYITGAPIEKYIKLTSVELKDLWKRKARREKAAAYVLYRLTRASNKLD